MFSGNKCMVNCYCLLLGLVFFVEIAGGILAIVFMTDIQSSLKTGLTNALSGYVSRLVLIQCTSLFTNSQGTEKFSSQIAKFVKSDVNVYELPSNYRFYTIF